MAVSKATRPTFSFARGINSDANLLSFPAGFARDIENYELQNDQSIRRRGALETESTLDVAAVTDESIVYRTFKWPNVNEDPSFNFVVYQIGSTLYFCNDDELGNDVQVFSIDLTARMVSGATSADVETNPCQCAAGRGHLFVVGKYIEPFYVAYNTDEDTITVTPIYIKERDFQGVRDGIPDTSRPASLTSSYNYNLLNAGWKQDDIDQFFTDKSVYPSKNMIPWLGYRRTVVTGVADQDGTKEFSSDKIFAELFQDAPAPKGHFIRTVFDTATLPMVDETVDQTASITSITPETAGINNSILLTTTSAHGLSPSDIITLQIANTGVGGAFFTDLMYVDALGNLLPLGLSNVQLEVITTPTATTFTVELVFPSDYVDTGDLAEYVAYVYISHIDTTGGFVSPFRTTTVEFFAGRVWYAGTPYRTLSSKIFFTQTIESELQYGKCYQVADPTDEHISDLVATDGGVISIPDMQVVKKIKAYSSRLIIYASNGVWEVGPGSSGYFTADSYSIRKIADTVVESPFGVCATAEGQPAYWALDGIYTIVQDTNTGYLTSQSITDDLISTLYNEIPFASKEVVQCTYDEINKRVIWIYPEDTTCTALILEYKTGGFFKHRFPGGVKSIFVPKTSFAVDDVTKVKYVFNHSDGSTRICTTTERSTYIDLDRDVEFTAYILHGFDTAAAPQFNKYAPTIIVYSKRTETLESGLIRNESGTWLRVRWDWSDNSVSGKWGPLQEVYRPRRFFVPSEPDGDLEDGFPVVVTQNKIRGRGRSLQLMFQARSGMDSHLIGWATNFDVLTDNSNVRN